MKWTCGALVVFVVVTAVLTAAERHYDGAREPSVEEDNYGLFRHMGPDDTIVNLPGGQHARDNYQFSKLQERHAAKSGVNQLRRRRSAVRRSFPVDENNF